MATSPNYGWLEPDNTDLVKNGALAIRTLGNAIDTTMATMTPKSIVDAKGDLIAASANDTPARLAVGNNGETLVADSSTSTGLRYTAGTVQSNPVINSAFQIAQRGTSVSVAANTSAYTLDRWQTSTGANQACTIARVATGDTTNLPFIQYAMRYQRNSGQTGTSGQSTYQSMESVNSIPFSGKTVTISVYARKGADYSATSSILQFNLVNGTGTDQSIYSGLTGQNTVSSNNMTLTTTWQRFTYTGTVPTNSTQLAIGFGFQFQGTAGANDYFEVTGVQIDVGSVALPFRTNAETIQGELAACQRYYYRWTGGAVNFQSGLAVSTSAIWYFINPKVTPRVAPTSIENSGLNVYNVNSATGYSSGTWALSQANPDGVIISYTHGSAVFTLASYGNILYGGAGTSYLAYSAEL
jgi:hypothetical protein